MTPGQGCTFASSPLAPTRIAGNVTMNHGSFALLGGALNGNLSETAGAVTLGQGAQVSGNLQVSGASTLAIDGATTGGNLQIQQVATGQSQSTICGAQVKGNLASQNNASPLALGTDNTTNCPPHTVRGNRQADNNNATLSIDYDSVGGNLQVQNNTDGVDVSSNNVSNNLQCENNNPVPTHIALNHVGGQAQGQCAAFQ